jgi:hypothetical protein
MKEKPRRRIRATSSFYSKLPDKEIKDDVNGFFATSDIFYMMLWKYHVCKVLSIRRLGYTVQCSVQYI